MLVRKKYNVELSALLLHQYVGQPSQKRYRFSFAVHVHDMESNATPQTPHVVALAMVTVSFIRVLLTPP